MIPFLIGIAIQALLLMLAVGTVGGVKRSDNTFPTAALAAVVLGVVGWVMAKLGVLGVVFWPIAWMFAVKSIYDIGWLRAAAIGVFLVGVFVVTMMMLAAVFGVAVAGLGILL